MKVLFSALHFAYFRNFESVIRELAARGHHVHLAADEPEALGGRELAERLAQAYPDLITWDFAPSLEEEPWFETARKLRHGLDYARALLPLYASTPKLRLRARERAPRIVRAAAQVPGIGPVATRKALIRIERLLPTSQRLVEYLQRHAPDVVVLTSLTYSRSQQIDMLKAARALHIPSAAAIMSWDHLSSKALVHLVPDKVIVWNEVQKREAIDMHGVPPERIVLTGAQCYDQWFTRTPARTREEFCRAIGLRSDRPFVLWVHSALSPTPEPPEPVLVMRWIEALRASADPQLCELGVLVRPHPERLKEWAGFDVTGYENVAFHGRNPIDAAAKTDYFDSLCHCSAVVGLVTSAFLEAAVVGRPVLTFMLPEYRMHQQEMLHFRYLLDVEGGLLHTAPDIPAHLQQLKAALTLGGARDERNARFLGAFVRPAGLDREATPLFVEAVERLQREGTRPDPSLAGSPVLRHVTAALAARATSRPGQWLLNDLRDDAWDADRERKERSRDSREQAKTEYQRTKLRARDTRRRREALRRVAKGTRSAMRKARHRTAVTAWRALAIAGLSRGVVRGAEKDR